MVYTRLQIPLVCVEGSTECASCAETLRARLSKRDGVQRVAVNVTDHTTQLELDYDSELVPWAELEMEISRTSACIKPEWRFVVMPLASAIPPAMVGRIEEQLRVLPGVSVVVSPNRDALHLEFDYVRCCMPDIVRRLESIGVRPRLTSPDFAAATPPAAISPTKSSASRALRWMAVNRVLSLPLLGGLCLLGAQLVPATGAAGWLRPVLLVASFALAARYTIVTTVQAFREFRFEVDVLMFAAAAGACLLGRFDEAALLLFLFGVGTAGEQLALGRAKQAIAALGRLAPEKATVRDPDGHERVVRVEDLRPGQQVVVHPSERLPADGVVIGGASAVDQSAITGESVPIEKTSGDPLFAGTINGNGTLLMSVERPASESTLARIIALVEAAQASKSPTEALTHRIERRYVPAILVATAALIVLPPVLGGGAWGVWFYRAMAFLTAASPCALAIGTPAAVLSGIARAARGGVLIKGGAHLEMLGRVRAIAFDKTGTLTSGHAVVTEVLSLNGAAVDEIVRYAAAVEKGSAHPLAQAIVADAESRNGFVTRAEDVRQQPGLGITGMVNGKTVAVGQPRLLATVQADVTNRMSELEAQGRTAVLVALDQTPIGIIGISDQPRASARRVVAELRAAGIEKVVVLTGDNAQSAAAIARDVGVQTCYAGLMPADKLARIHELRETYGCVAMVGDGVNDAPALAAADLGIAMGGAGTHVALETADVALMADDLAKLPEAIGLGRFSRRVIVQNLVIALGVIAVLAPCAALGMATLGVAVVFHEGSTVLVVLNALRLLAYRPRPSRVSQPSELQDACA